MGDGHLRKGEGLHAPGEAGGNLRAVEDVLRGEGRQAASEEGAVLPVERVGAVDAVVVEEGLPVGRVGAAAAVDCSCCRTCDVIPPPNKGQKKREEQSNSGAIIPPPPQETEKRRSNLFVSAKQAVLTKENGQNSHHISSPKIKEESSQLILKEGKTGDEHKRVDE